MASVEERLKLKRGKVDPWSTRERLCLASSVVRSGNQNWMSVSRSLKVFGGEPGRPADWFSQKSCAVQYDNLLTQIETPKRKKRGADGSKAEGVDMTPAEVIVKQLTGERIQELRNMMDETRAVYMRDKEEMYRVQNGLADDKLDEFFMQIQQEKKLKEAEQEEQQKLLKQREERKPDAEAGWRAQTAQQQARGAAARRPSNQSELGSEADNAESPSSSDQLPVSEEVVEPKPASTPTSPLLTSLLESPSPVSGPQSSSILHSAITSQRGASPTITSLLNSSPGVPSSSTTMPLSPNLKSLVSNALAGHEDVPKPQTSRSASSSPTLSMLLGLPPSTPGKLPQLPYSATKEPASTPTSKPGDKDQSTVELGSEAEGPKPAGLCQSSVESTLDMQGPKSPECSTTVQRLSEINHFKSAQAEQVIIPQEVPSLHDAEILKPSENKQNSKYQVDSVTEIEEPIVDHSSQNIEPQPALPEVKKLNNFPPDSKPLHFEILPEMMDMIVDEIQPISNQVDTLDELEGQVAPTVVLAESEVENVVPSIKQIEHHVVPDQYQKIINPPNEGDCLKTMAFSGSLSEHLDDKNDPKNCQGKDQKTMAECEKSLDQCTSAEAISDKTVSKTLDYGLEHSVSQLPSALTKECQPEVETTEPSVVEVSISPGHCLQTGDHLPVYGHLASPKQSQPPSTLETIHSESNVVPLQVTSNGALQQGGPSIGTPSAPVKGPTDTLVETASPRAVDSLKKEPVPDVNNMEVVLPVDVETKAQEAENKDNLDPADLPQISPDDLEYVVDPSIDVVLQEFGPEGLVDEMVYIVSTDVETDIGNMLDAADTNDTTTSEQVESKIQPDLTKDSEINSSQEQSLEKNQSEPVVHPSPVRQSTQSTVSTPSSGVTSPRTVGRPAKGNMGPRKIVMEEEDLLKTEVSAGEQDLQQTTEDPEALSREALDLENASVLFVQDNGELVKLSESGQATSVIENIHVIQDPSSSGVVVVPHHDDAVKNSEADSSQSSKSITEESSDDNVEEQTGDSCEPSQKNDQLIELKSPSSNLQKSSEKSDLKELSPAKTVDVLKSDEDTSSDVPDIPAEADQELESSQPEEDNSVIEPNESDNKASEIVEEIKEEVVEKRNEPLSPREELKKQRVSSPPLSPREGLKKQKISSPPHSPREGLKKQRVASPAKREKSPVSSESSNELVSEDDNSKQDTPVIAKKDDNQDKVKVQEAEKQTLDIQTEEDDTRHTESEAPVVQIKEEKTLRAETPSTEDDNTRDTEPAPPPVKRGRGRYARDSINNSDSVPNSPVPSGASHDDEKEHRAWKKSIMLVYNRIAAHKNASIFLRPITDDKAPDYSSMIRRRFDLQTIKKNIETGAIRSTDEFQRDILLMFYNAIMYNVSGSPLYDMAREMQEESVTHLNEYRNTQLYVSTVGAEGGHLPSRRGTRTAEKRDQESEGFSTRRGAAEKSNATRGVFSSNILGKRKRSMPDDRVTPKRRKDDD